MDGFIKDNSPQAPSNYADSGSKSRYFDIDVWGEKHGLIQCPKASKKERNAGCEGLEEKKLKGWVSCLMGLFQVMVM